MMSLTTSPIEITPTTLPASSTGRWRKPRAAIIAMQPSSWSSGLTVTGSPVITWPTGGDARHAQEQRRVADPWEDILTHMPNHDHLIYRSGDGYERVASADVLTRVLDIPKAQQTSAHGQRLANAMKHAGWDRNPVGGLPSMESDARVHPPCHHGSLYQL